MDGPVTRRELHEVLELWGGALEARLDAKLDAKLDAVRSQLSAEIQGWGRQLSAELQQHTNRILEETRTMVGVVDDKYSDLPGRVTVLEQ